MSLRLFILIFIFSQSIFVSAQITFQKTYDAPGFGASTSVSVEATSDSGFIFAGNQFMPGNIDAFITKVDSTGNVDWSQSYGDLRPENIFAVKQILNGSYVVVGASRSFSNDSLNEMYVVQFNSSGAVEWEKIYGSLTGAYEMAAHRISQTSDGGFVIGGNKDEFNVSMYYMKTDATGNILWGKYISGVIGTYGLESIQQTTDGGYIITGNGGRLIKTDSSGIITWSKSYLSGMMSFYAQETSDGGFMLTGETNANGTGPIDYCLIKTNISGDVTWCKTYGGVMTDNLRAAQQTTDGGYILAGSTSSFGAGSNDMYLIKTDSMGTLVWSKTYGSSGDELCFSVDEAAGGGFIVCGYSNTFGSGSLNAYLVRTDENGSSGCNDSTPLTVVSSPGVVATQQNDTALAFIPDTYTPVSNVGAGLVEGLLCLSVSSAIEEVRDPVISIVPNPANDYFIIEFDKNINKGAVELFNILGEKILSEKVSNESKKAINLENISDGIYFVKIQDEKRQYCRKVIIE